MGGGFIFFFARGTGKRGNRGEWKGGVFFSFLTKGKKKKGPIKVPNFQISTGRLRFFFPQYFFLLFAPQLWGAEK